MPGCSGLPQKSGFPGSNGTRKEKDLLMKKWSLSGIKIYNGQKYIKSGSIAVNNGKIERVSSKEATDYLAVEVENGIAVPGLINSHDHLLGTYYPKVGNGPYENWLPWDNDLKSSPVYQERQQIENRDLYLLGAYRNLVSGVTLVSDHIPHFVGDPFYDLLPVKAVREFGMAHSIASFALAWGDGVEIEYKKAVEADAPFVTHIAEGFDAETVNDLQKLDKQKGLGEHSVLVHGIAFSESDMKLIKRKGSSVVWCGDSNMFMFNETTNIKMLLDMGINVCIGTDSPMSGGLNLLHEMRFDRDLYEKMYGEKLSDETIFKMVTENPVKAFRVKGGGMLKEGSDADIVVFNDTGGDSPESSVVNAELKDVMLVVIDGRPVYGDADFSGLFDALKIDYQHISLKGGTDKIVAGDLKGLLKRISRAVGFKKELPFLPFQFEF